MYRRLAVSKKRGFESAEKRHTRDVDLIADDDLKDAGESVVISAFYKFVPMPDVAEFRDRVLDVCDRAGMFGSILIAPEGINGTVAGSNAATDELFDWLRSDPRFTDLQVKRSFDSEVPFRRMKVRLKREIVTFGHSVDPTVRVGTYVDPGDWNDVISDPDVLVIDTRNAEEVSIGTFENAVDPDTESFGEFADFVATLDPTRHSKVAMFCTGGIRCEKASSYMLGQGFGEVLHLKGGILQYLEDVDPAESLWRGECFVFDERVTVDHELQAGDYTLCRGCRRALAEEDRAEASYEEGVCCASCVDSLTDERADRLRERHRQMHLAHERGVPHLASKPPQ